MYEFNLHYEFPLEDGKVVIRNPGLYLIYAQVMYDTTPYYYNLPFSLTIDPLKILKTTVALLSA